MENILNDNELKWFFNCKEEITDVWEDTQSIRHTFINKDVTYQQIKNGILRILFNSKKSKYTFDNDINCVGSTIDGIESLIKRNGYYSKISDVGIVLSSNNGKIILCSSKLKGKICTYKVFPKTDESEIIYMDSFLGKANILPPRYENYCFVLNKKDIVRIKESQLPIIEERKNSDGEHIYDVCFGIKLNNIEEQNLFEFRIK